MAGTKAVLKSIKSAIDGGDFAQASAQAADLLKNDSKNYHAWMFLGFAEEKLKHLSEAEKALRKALDLKPEDVQPYKGLIRLYEQQGSDKVSPYHEIAFALAGLYAQADDREQCQNVVNQYELFAKKHGSRAQYRQALQLTLPSSPLYPSLEGRVPHPSHTYQRILESSQAEEKQWIDAQIAERRTRLGARLESVKAEVRYEAIEKFKVEQAYQSLIDWTQDDEVRHVLDQELLQRMIDNLLAIPPEEKPQQRDKVLEKANGMVIIKQQFELAWKIALEWVDTEDLAEWDPSILFEYIAYFPDVGLAKVIKGYLYGSSSPFPLPEPGDAASAPQKLSDADQLILMMEGLEECKDSMLAHRMMAFVYLNLSEHERAADMARSSAMLYRKAEKDFAMPLQDSLDAVNLILGRSLVIYQSPRHHPEARKIFEDILARKPRLTEALLGIGLVYEEDEDYSEAVRFLGKAIDEDPANTRIRLEFAWCKALDRDLAGGLEILEGMYELLEDQNSEDANMRAELLYRIAYCKWHLDDSPKARKDKNGPYRYLLDALRLNPRYAPAYTLLGFYFLNYGKNKKRAQTAFHRAFEYSPSEIAAAEQLAQIYAMDAEWDLVELVSQRVVDSGNARPAPGSKKQAHSWPYAALGVVQMSRSQYSLSIVSFQHALRISPDSYHSWVGLGESYHNSGRYVAASKAFQRAESIDHGLSAEESWFAQYMLANVQRELGLYDEAVKAYEKVLTLRSNELGVLLSLLQTLVDFGWTRIHQGHFGHAAELAAKALDTASVIASSKTDLFNLWKAVGDACAVMNASKSFAQAKTTLVVVKILQSNVTSDELDMLEDVDQIAIKDLSEEQTSIAAVCEKFSKAAILAYKRGIHACSNDAHAQAVSWYNLGWAEYDAYQSSIADATKSKRPRGLLKAAVKCFKHAIELEPSNSDFWNALGVITLTLSPRASQHALIRSLHLNDHNARAWTNLGTLYLTSNEFELANEAYTRAQSTDPEYAPAWIGQGLLATLLDRSKEAAGLFKHAYEIADSSSTASKRHYAVTAFDHIVTDVNKASDVSALIQPLFALCQLQTQSLTDIITKHFLSLFAERVFEFAIADANLTRVTEAVEAQYENSESIESLSRFAQAKADLARQLLGQQKFEEALENAQFALDVTEDDTLGPSYTTRRNKLRLSAQVTAGLAHSFLQQMSESIKMLQAAANTSKSLSKGKIDPNVTIMLAQVLWAAGGDKEREAARTQLFDCIEDNPDHVGAATLLAVVAVLDDDSATLEVAVDDLKSLRMKSKVGVIDKLHIAKVLAGVLLLKSSSGGDCTDASNDALNSILLAPHQPQGWMELAQMTSDDSTAEMAIKTALRQIPPGGKLTSEDLARTYAIRGKVDDMKQASFIAPWLKE